MAYEEYLRRNLIVCGSFGAEAGVRTALNRLAQMKRQPKWLVEQLKAIGDRVMESTPELIKWRSIAYDNPRPTPEKQEEPR